MAYVQRVRHPFWHRNREAVNRHSDVVVRDNYFLNVVSRIIWLAAGIVTLLLAFRFILALLSANPRNGFVNFIYDVSHPFAAPFFGIFNYNDVYVRGSGSHVEVYTLVAIAVYLAAAWILTALVNIGRR